MALESQYKDLLNPVKDIEKSFSIDISELLSNFIKDLGSKTPNFNSAALLIQGSASVYGKKVEYLYTLANRLYHNITKQNELQEQNKKETKDKDKEKKEKQDKFSDPFHSVDFKMGKNLSCLRKKNLPKTNSKKSAKKCCGSGIPVHLLSSDNDDKGDVFYDTRGEIVGNKGDFAINKCRLMSSGWLLLPTVNPALVPSLEAIPDYYDDLDNAGETEGVEGEVDDFDELQGSPGDEGFQSCPPSSDIQESVPESNMNSDANNVESQTSESAMPSADEGIGGTPDVDMVDSPGTSEGIENVPTEDGDEIDINSAPMPIRPPRKQRQALRPCQLAVEDDPLVGVNITKDLLKRRKIEKNNVRCLPPKLKNPPGTPVAVESISLFCARTFFDMSEKFLHVTMMEFDTKCFDQNTHFMKRMSDKILSLKILSRKKNIEPIEDEREVDVGEVEILKEANEDDETLHIPFDENDIQLDYDPIPMEHRPVRTPIEDDLGSDSVPAADMPSPDINHIGTTENEKYMTEVQNYIQNSDITKRVHEWEESVKPFLDELEERESFDINMYGSRILNSFEDNNRKQTMTFRQFCRNKEKWEVHRYFMALLPLANVGNVSIESEPKEDGTEEIFVTLLSRKMHHKELEEFGHSDGSHS